MGDHKVHEQKELIKKLQEECEQGKVALETKVNEQNELTKKMQEECQQYQRLGDFAESNIQEVKAAVEALEREIEKLRATPGGQSAEEKTKAFEGLEERCKLLEREIEKLRATPGGKSAEEKTK